MRRLNQFPKPDTKFKFRPGAYAILPLKNHVLLTFQGGRHQEFQLPGGGIDPKEGKTSALHREVLEETGWRIHKPIFLTAYRRFAFMPNYGIWAEKICNIYVAQPIRQISEPLEKDHQAALVPSDQAIKLLSNKVDAELLRSLLTN